MDRLIDELVEMSEKLKAVTLLSEDDRMALAARLLKVKEMREANDHLIKIWETLANRL